MSTVNRYAALPAGSNQVHNIILAEEGFILNGYTLQVIASEVFCDVGMFYNTSDGLYYQDPEFTVIHKDSDNGELY